MLQAISHYFKMPEKKASFTEEIFSGLIGFCTVAYILFLNPEILQQAGVDFNAALTATIIVTGFATLWMAILGRYPFIVGPGMGMNAAFTYGVIIGEGYSIPEALGAVFISGALLFLLGFFGLREKLFHVIPNSLKVGTVCGIGLFLGLIGLKILGVVVPHKDTFVALGNLQTPTILLAFLEFLFLGYLLKKQVKASFLIALLATTFFSILFNISPFYGIFSLPPSLEPHFFTLNLNKTFTLSYFPIIFSFLLVSILDGAGSILSLQTSLYKKLEKPLIPHHKIAQGKWLFTADAAGSILSSFLGCSPCSNYLESNSIIQNGGKTGFSSLIASLCFFTALFFSPFIHSIPSFAIAPFLIILAVYMVSFIKELNTDDFLEMLPFIVTLLIIPFTFSIANGIALGLLTHTGLYLLCGKWKSIPPILFLLTLLFCLNFFFISKLK